MLSFDPVSWPNDSAAVVDFLTRNQWPVLVDEAPDHTPPVVAFDHHAWRFIRALHLEGVILRTLETLHDHQTDPIDTIRLLLERHRAPGLAVAGILAGP